MLAMGSLLGLEPAGGDTLANDTLSAELGLASVMAIGNRTPYYLPVLLGLIAGMPLVHRTPAVLGGRETLAGVESYKVVIRGHEVTRTYWVDTATYLLRQLQDEQTGAQVAGMFEQIGDKMAERDTSSNPAVGVTSALVTGALRAMPRPQGATYLVRFSNLSANIPLAPELFALPPPEPSPCAPE